MKFKKEYIILAVVIMLLSIYLFQRKTDRTLYQLPELPKVEAKEITKIELTRPKEMIILNKKDENWYIGPQDFQAEKNQINEILEVLEKLTLTALVSETKDYQRYDLDQDNKILIRAWAGENLIREFEIGKTLSASSQTFVKISGDERVYHARSNFRSKLDRSVDEMRDKTVLSYSVADIHEIHFTKGKESVSFYRKKSPLNKEGNDSGKTPIEGEMVWKNADDQPASESKLNNIITTLSSLKCKGYIKGKNKDAFTKPMYTIKLKGTREYSLSIFDESKEYEKDHPAVSTENEYPFLLYQWRVKNLMPEFKEFLKGQKK